MMKKIWIVLNVIVLSMPILSQQSIAEVQGSSDQQSEPKPEPKKEANVRDLYSRNALAFIWDIDRSYPYILLVKKNNPMGQQDVTTDQLSPDQKVILMTEGKEPLGPLSAIQRHLPNDLLPILAVEGQRSKASWVFNTLAFYLPYTAVAAYSIIHTSVEDGAAPLAVRFTIYGLYFALIEYAITESVDPTSWAGTVFWPAGYIANQSKASSAADEVEAYLNQEENTKELVVLVPTNLFRAIQMNLVENPHFSVVQEYIYPSRWTTQVIP